MARTKKLTAAEAGSRGGFASAANMTDKQRRARARKAALAKHAKRKKV